MKTFPHILIVFLFIHENFASGEPTLLPNHDLMQEKTTENFNLKISSVATTEIIEEVTHGSVLVEKLIDLENEIPLADKQFIQIVLEDVANLTSSQVLTSEANSTEYLVNVISNPISNSEKSQNFHSSESELVRLVLEGNYNLTKNAEPNFTSLNSQEDITTPLMNLELKRNNSSTEAESNTQEPSAIIMTISTETAVEKNIQTITSLESNSNFTEAGPVLKDLQQEDIENSTELLNEKNFKITTISLDSLEASQSKNLLESELVQIVFKDVVTPLTHKQDEKPEISLESSVETVKNITVTTTATTAAITSDITAASTNIFDITTTTSAIIREPNTKTPVGLEEYFLKQMNFILDHLLLETKEFVVKVLQASINSVFPRDHLKRYAEDLNQLLNPDKKASQDELYEKIVKKLNFLKSAPSKYLQRHLPQEWIKDFLTKRLEFVIWLDKAAEEMHKEFIFATTEEEDHIKFQYFNETFDDISRATEIHQKLAFLFDLLKIVTNKKQISFMDLYMQI